MKDLEVDKLDDCKEMDILFAEFDLTDYSKEIEEIERL